MSGTINERIKQEEGVEVEVEVDDEEEEEEEADRIKKS